MRKIQIGVMGSAADVAYPQKLENTATRIGELIAEKDCVLIFGAEKDTDSISAAACRGARSKGGLTVGITYNKTKDVFEKETNIVIATGLERGGGREFVLVNSCDAVIAIRGGSGTLSELAIAYQSDIPIIVVQGTGGWAEKLAGDYLDERRRRKPILARTPEEAVKQAIDEGKSYIQRYG